jgi:isoquinoline 1-oxidoreductase beta subunit
VVSRRGFVLGALAGAGALVVGWSLMPPRQRLVGSTALPLAAGQSALNGWVKIGTDDRVTVMISKSEMGQGVTTALAMLLADELDARWDQVSVESSPIDPIYNNVATVVDGLPFHPDDHGPVRSTLEWLTAKSIREFGLMVTGGSSSIKDLWLPMREAGASARAMLANAAAQRWQVPLAECQIAEGRVTHASGKAARFGELAAQAASGALPGRVPLKRIDQFRLIGQPTRRIDAGAKLVGAARFGIDMVLPGMLHARVLMCPTLGGTVASFDAAQAVAMPGVRKVVAVKGYNGGTAGVAVIADQPYRAMQALAKVAVQWQPGPAAGFSSERFERELTATLERETGYAYYTQGDATAALANAARTVSATYSAPYLAHAALEPMNCTVLVEDARATVWASTQVPGGAPRRGQGAGHGHGARSMSRCSSWAAASGGGWMSTSSARRPRSPRRCAAPRCRRSGRASRT